jgi:hypothetical protein
MAANRHDSMALTATLDAVPGVRSGGRRRPRMRPGKLPADNASHSRRCRRGAAPGASRHASYARGSTAPPTLAGTGGSSSGHLRGSPSSEGSPPNTSAGLTSIWPSPSSRPPSSA